MAEPGPRDEERSPLAEAMQPYVPENVPVVVTELQSKVLAIKEGETFFPSVSE